MSYNVLADCYTNQEFFPFASLDNLQFLNRFPKNIRSIMQLNPDIICLQEVDNYPQYKKAFKELGYNINYSKKLLNKMDGVLIAARSNKFTILKNYTINLDKMKIKNSNEKFITGYVAQVSLINFNSFSKRILVASTHFKPLQRNIQFAQYCFLISQLEEIITKEKLFDVGVIICGDFNAIVGSEIFQKLYLNKIEIPENFAKTKVGMQLLSIDEQFHSSISLLKTIKSAYENYRFITKEAEFNPLLSPYQNLMNGYPKFTNYSHNFFGYLDYILFSVNLQLFKLARLPDEKIVKSEVGLPNSSYGSDHLPIAASFYFK